MPLPRQRIDVELANGEEFELECINPDMLRFETEGHKYGLSREIQDAPFTYMTFVAWAALKRLGKYDGDWPTFKTRDCVVMVPIDADEAGDVPPTQPAPAPSSVSPSL